MINLGDWIEMLHTFPVLNIKIRIFISRNHGHPSYNIIKTSLFFQFLEIMRYELFEIIEKSHRPVL